MNIDALPADQSLLDRLVDRLNETLRRGYVPLDKQLWTPADIGAYLGVSRRTVAERYAARPDFPRAIRLPSEGQRGLLRWRAKDVMTWVERRQWKANK